MITPVRGTLILADNVYQTVDHKWIISGTYSRWQTGADELVITQLMLYLRLQFEHYGTFPTLVTMIDRAASPTVPPLAKSAFNVVLKEPQPLCYEGCVRMPELRFPAPIPLCARPPGSATRLGMLMTLECADIVIASCDLDLIFVGPTPAQV